MSRVIKGDLYEFTERNCMRTRLGKDYVGDISVAVGGSKCLPWSSIDILKTLRYDLPEALQSGADPFAPSVNYCRNIPGLGWQIPMCYTEQLPMTPTRCDIPTCGKQIYTDNH